MTPTACRWRSLDAPLHLLRNSLLVQPVQQALRALAMATGRP